jgi:hypothetical protein
VVVDLDRAVSIDARPLRAQDEHRGGLWRFHFGGHIARPAHLMLAVTCTLALVALLRPEGAIAAVPEHDAARLAPAPLAVTLSAASVESGSTITITATGTASRATTLYIFGFERRFDCPLSERGQTSVWIVTKQAVNAGPFSVALPYKSGAPGYTAICAFLTSPSASQPLARARALLSVQSLGYQLQVSVPATTLVGHPTTLEVSGQMAEPSQLSVFLTSNPDACGIDLYDELGSPTRGDVILVREKWVGRGPFTQDFSFTPAAPVAYSACAEVTDDSGTEAVAAAPLLVQQVPAHASMKISIAGTRRAGQHLTVSVVAKSDLAERVWTILTPNATTCASTAASALARRGTIPLIKGQPVNNATTLRAIITARAGRYRICGYIAHTAQARPDAVAAAALAVAK